MPKTSRGSPKDSDDRDQDAKGSERSWRLNTTVDIWIKSHFGDIFTKVSSEVSSQMMLTRSRSVEENNLDSV